MKKIKIYVGDTDFSDKLSKRIWKDPERFADQYTIVVPPELFSKVFTKERLRLLKALEKKPKNMGELTEMLKRPREAVSRDMSYLAGMGIVDVEKNGKERIPTRAGEISVSM